MNRRELFKVLAAPLILVPLASNPIPKIDWRGRIFAVMHTTGGEHFHADFVARRAVFGPFDHDIHAVQIELYTVADVSFWNAKADTFLHKGDTLTLQTDMEINNAIAK